MAKEDKNSEKMVKVTGWLQVGYRLVTGWKKLYKN